MRLVPQSDARDWIRDAAQRWQGELALYAARLVGGNAEWGRDVAQDALVQLCQQEESRVRPIVRQWLFSVVRNRALDVRTKENRMTLLTDEQAGRVITPSDGPLETMEREETESNLLTALSKLPDDQQEVLRLKLQHDLSYEEISRIMNRSIASVGYLIHTGLNTLRERLKPRIPV